MKSIAVITRQRLAVLSLFIILIGIISATLFFSPSATAAPAVSWHPKVVNETIQPGQSRTIPVTLTASENVPSASIRVVPSLQPFVSVAPANTGPLQKGQTVQITLNVSAGIDALPITASGTVQLRRTGKNEDSRSQRQNDKTDAQMRMENENENDDGGSTLSQPLPVSVNVVWPTFSTPSGISFSYPPSMVVSTDPQDGTITLRPTISTPGPDDVEGVPSLYVTVDPNPSGLSLGDYYDGDPGADLDPSAGVVTVGRGSTGYRFEPAATLAGDVVVVVPTPNGFIQIIDHGVAFQENGIFARILASFQIGS